MKKLQDIWKQKIVFHNHHPFKTQNWMKPLLCSYLPLAAVLHLISDKFENHSLKQLKHLCKNVLPIHSGEEQKWLKF